MIIILIITQNYLILDHRPAYQIIMPLYSKTSQIFSKDS